MFHKKVKKQFFKTYTSCNHDINKFVLFLGKCADPYEYIRIIRKNSMKFHYLKKKIFAVT